MIGYVIWGLLFAGLVTVEGLGLTLRGHEWPTVSDMFRTATRPTAGRWIFFALWLWAGWHFFIRGWHFFLQGRGAGDPNSEGGGKTFGATLTQVIVPLLGLYAMLATVAWRGYRRSRLMDKDTRRRAFATGARRARTEPLAFLRYTVLTTLGGYAILVLTMGGYELAAGRSASGVFGSALLYGAFLAFAVGVPVFFALSFVEGTVRDRLGTGDERPRPDGPDAAPEAPDRGAPAAGGEVAD